MARRPPRPLFVEGATRMIAVLSRFLVLGLAVTAVLAAGGVAHAADGQPSPWQLGFQDSASTVMDDVVWFHTYVLYFITVITVFVLRRLLIGIVRFNRPANPNPSRTTHSTPLEVAWTVVPVIILVAIAVPSFRLLFFQQTIPPSDLTVKATGAQWYWT